MSGDIIGDLLGKLSQRTGREWTLSDIMKLAEKMPKDGKNIDSVLSELSNMGLDVPEETKERVKNQMQSGKKLSLDELGKMLPRDVKGKSGKKSSVSRANGKSSHLSLAQRVKKLSSGRKKKR
ncbi:hypothetical protein T458_13275 [Brevibacillus panacihumi W25]|uniref:Uncharacterized protein n=2 Tax=Brevibacillus panacihumi TaxID=497735 RepID=V6M6U4_9BACL|nr:hypothetical protein [Brevibacillus panacihumi]EST54306.1 hypothetical protein T458_13275 [Brevibacillus panacihumi W25]RNB77153.1 hypothetical protein EDM58_16135 [Brevibacillus panacihumi]